MSSTVGAMKLKEPSSVPTMKQVLALLAPTSSSKRRPTERMALRG
jgi:hypothetical protein